MLQQFDKVLRSGVIYQGTVVPILSDRDGVQQLEIPAGIHRIQVSFEHTLPRTAGTALSGVALVMIPGLFVLDYVKRRRGGGPDKTRGSGSTGAVQNSDEAQLKQ